MLPLFELAKLCDFTSCADKKDSIVSQYTLKKVGNKNFCAIYFNSGSLSLWQLESNGNRPLVCMLPWPASKPVISMSFDASATWLLCSSLDGTLYIVPFAHMLIPDCTLTGPWKRNDVTKIKVAHKHGATTCLCWWQTFTGGNIAIICTKLGFLIFVDLLTGRVLRETDVNELVYSISLIGDDSQMFTYALITTRSNLQWKQLLEKRTEVAGILRQAQHLGYEVVEAIHPAVSSILNPAASEFHEFNVLRFSQFKSSVNLSPQYAKGRHFIGAHDMKSSLLKIFESSLEHSAVYMYQLPETCQSLLYCDRLSFLTLSRETSNSLIVWSNQLAETSFDDLQMTEAVVQEFNFPASESILSITKQSFTESWMKRLDQEAGLSGQESDVWQVNIDYHTVLDGCLIITNRGIYSCRPRVSPERYFLHLACATATYKQADRLGIIVGLDVHTMYQKAAQLCLNQGKSVLALSLFKLGKCPFKDRIRLLIVSGRVKEATLCLRQLLTTKPPRHSSRGTSEISKTQKQALSNLAVHCFVYEVLVCTHSEDRQKSEDMLRDFLETTYTFDKHIALHLLVQHRMIGLLHNFVLGRGLEQSSLNILMEDGSDANTKWSVLNKDGFDQLVKVQSPPMEDLWPLLSLVEMNTLLDNEVTAMNLVRHLRSTMKILPPEALLCVADLFLPSTEWLEIGWTDSSFESLGSQNESLRSESQWLMKSSTSVQLQQLTDVFTEAVILLHMHSIKAVPCSDIMKDAKDTLKASDKTDGDVNEARVVQELRQQSCVVSCGAQHAACVVADECFTWGHAADGRLGRGSSSLVNDHRPLLIESLPEMKLSVTSVSCGAAHCLAITEKGVLGWGSSALGQLGVGTRGSYILPVAITELSHHKITKVTCGQYHSIALTTDSRVLTWGWGVHGQLGHSDVEDKLLPCEVGGLEGARVVSVAGGHSHTLLLAFGGDVLVCGSGVFGQNGHADSQKIKTPCQLKFPEAIRSISTKFFHSLAIGVSNTVYMWGTSPDMLRLHVSMLRRLRQTGKLHTGQAVAVDNFHTPRPVNTARVKSHILQGVCGLNMSGLLTRDGGLYTWGSNQEGQLGLGSSADDSSLSLPHNVAIGAKINSVAMGKDFAIAMDSKENIWGWGSSRSGQLGRKSSSDEDADVSYRRGLQSINQEQDLIYKPRKIPVPASRDIRKKMKSVKHNDLNAQGVEWCFVEINSSEIPEMRGTGRYPYTHSSLVNLLKCSPALTDVSSVMDACRQHQDYLTAAFICKHNHQYSQVLHYMGEFLSAQKLSKAEFVQYIFESFDALLEYLGKTVSKCNESFITNWKDKLLHQVLTLCREVQVPLTLIENALHERLDNLSVSVLRYISGESSKHDNGLLFSLQFHIHLTNTLIKDLEQDRHTEACAAIFCNSAASDIDIPDFVHCDDGSCSIAVSSKDLSSVIQTDVMTEAQSAVYSCGHHMSALSHDQEMNIKLPQPYGQQALLMDTVLAAVNLQYRSKILPHACPKCICQGLKRIYDT